MLRRILTILMLVGLLWVPVAPQARASVIVQATDIATAVDLVRTVGGEVTHGLDIINAVSARLTTAQLAILAQAPAVVQIYDDSPVQVASISYTDGTEDPLQQLMDKVAQVGADQLHAQGITGNGVAIAFLDSGYYIIDELNRSAYGQNRIVAQYDATTDTEGLWIQDDQAGHGAHIMTTAASSYSTASDGTLRAPGGALTDNYHGIAPGIDLVSVKAFGSDGGGSYADVIRGINWVVAHKDTYNIRVLNCSFSAPPQSYYWDDPLNQAIMQAWQAGIVVVA
ncbi:MAG: S8 family serine peptidase, partial [Anaerolineae bacterium]